MSAEQTETYDADPDAVYDWQPPAYPICSTCEDPWVYKRGISFGGPDSGGYRWAWYRGCSHKKLDPIMVGRDGKPLKPRTEAGDH
jgi:hypothetical protein